MRNKKTTERLTHPELCSVEVRAVREARESPPSNKRNFFQFGPRAAVAVVRAGGAARQQRRFLLSHFLPQQFVLRREVLRQKFGVGGRDFCKLSKETRKVVSQSISQTD